MKQGRISITLLSIMVSCVVLAGKMEEYGGFKARDYKEGADGKLYTSNGSQVKVFTKDLTSNQQKECIIAAKMASSGYTDDRYDDYKNNFYKDNNGTGYEEADRKTLEKIILQAHKANEKSELYIKQETIKFKSNDASGKNEEGIKVLTIAGNGKSRLNARIFIRNDGSVGIVFGGTASLKDAVDDVLNVSPVTPTPKPYKEAAELLRAVKAVFPDTPINVYGHSEGGGEAMYAVLSEGVKNGTKDVMYYGVNSAGLNGLKTNDVITHNLDGKTLTKEDIETHFVLIQNQGEKLPGNIPVSMVAYQFGTVVLVPDMQNVFTEENDAKYVSRAKNKAFENLDGAHGIEETLWKMTHLISGNDDPLNSQPVSPRSNPGETPSGASNGPGTKGGYQGLKPIHLF